MYMKRLYLIAAVSLLCVCANAQSKPQSPLDILAGYCQTVIDLKNEINTKKDELAKKQQELKAITDAWKSHCESVILDPIHTVADIEKLYKLTDPSEEDTRTMLFEALNGRAVTQPGEESTQEGVGDTENKRNSGVKPDPISFDEVDEKPEFPGGEDAMYEWLKENIKYPSNARDVEDDVCVEFVVEEDGSIANAKVLGPGLKAFKEEALRVVNLMSKWTPGRNNGRNVRVLHTITISFKRPNTSKPKRSSNSSDSNTIGGENKF